MADKAKDSKPFDASGVFDLVTRAVFGVAAGILMILALVLVADAATDLISAAIAGKGVGLTALSAVGYVVVAIAVFEIAKYLIEEEVIRGRQMRVPSEARRSLTQFISTIAIAIFLESLVIVFRVSQEHVPYLIYPTLLAFVGILLVVGLGIFQRLSATVEQKVGQQDKDDGEKIVRPQRSIR